MSRANPSIDWSDPAMLSAVDIRVPDPAIVPGHRGNLSFVAAW
jgi:hypothetical protein